MPAEDADEMAKDFTQLVDDLAYAKTFYPSSKVTQYINSQASKIYLSIYKNRKEESNRLVDFWKYDLPLTIRKHYKAVLFSFIFFLIFFSIGFFVSKQDEGVARSFFGDGYVDKTLENIEKGNPFGIYEYGNPILSWLSMMINNIRVSLLMFASGIFAGVPTLILFSAKCGDGRYIRSVLCRKRIGASILPCCICSWHAGTDRYHYFRGRGFDIRKKLFIPRYY